MDSFITWEGVVATGALVVSLYNLRQARRAPAMARQRELRDKLRTMLEVSAKKIKGVRDAIRAGGEPPAASEFFAAADEMSQLGGRLTGRGGRVALVVAQLQSVGAHMMSVEAGRHRNATKEMLEKVDTEGVAAQLATANLDMAVRDLDDACKEADRVIANELKDLTLLESR